MKKLLLVLALCFMGTYSGFSQNENQTPKKGFKLSEISNKQSSSNSENSSMSEAERKSFQTAITKYNSKKYKEAIEILNLLVQQNPQKVSYYYYLAQAYHDNKQFNECVATCSKGLELGPKENLLNLYRAQANIELGNTATVCEDLKKSATQDESLLNKYCR